MFILNLMGMIGLERKPASDGFPTLSGTLLARWKANNEAYSNGATVTQINDISGNGRHLTPDSGKEPTFQTGVINGKSVYRFDANTDNAKAGSDWIDDTKATTFYIIVKTDGSAVQAFYGCANNNLIVIPLNTTSIRIWTTGSSSDDGTVTNTSAAFYLYVVKVNGTTGASGTSQLYQNNTLKYTTPSYTRVAFNNIWLGSTANSTSQGLDGDIAEAWVQEGAASADDLNNTWAYVQSVYGL